MNEENNNINTKSENTESIPVNEVRDSVFEDINNLEDSNKGNNSNKPKKPRKTVSLPSLGLALMLTVSAILGGVVGGFTTSKLSNNSVGNNITSSDNLTKIQGVDIPKNSITKVAESVGPAVVGISTSKSSWMDSSTAGSTGSGIVFDSNGYIVTNQHVIEGGNKIMVSLPSGKKVQAKIIGQDAKTDLAVLKVEEKNLVAAKFGNSDNVKVGETVVAIGNPLGEEFAGSVTSGIVSAKGRSMTINEAGQSRVYNGIQTDASINPGNSGGALLNLAGEVIGINTLKISSAEGMGFAIPINEVRTVIDELMKNGYIKRPYLGVATVYLDEQTAKIYQIPSGMGIQEVVRGSAADAAGIIPGDIIVEVDGKKITDQNVLTNVIATKKVGDTISLKIAKENGTVKTVNAKLTENKNNGQ
ncbi:MAG: trypsin-like peptidase domain-containing protein [Clostridium sp.]|uniref:S1C family serine protease n=1 Tax=Clostridium sp. TaxID=1506 RepID=UPI002FCC5BEF